MRGMAACPNCHCTARRSIVRRVPLTGSVNSIKAPASGPRRLGVTIEVLDDSGSFNAVMKMLDRQ
jgi:hypothetical protein